MSRENKIDLITWPCLAIMFVSIHQFGKWEDRQPHRVSWKLGVYVDELFTTNNESVVPEWETNIVVGVGVFVHQVGYKTNKIW